MQARRAAPNGVEPRVFARAKQGAHMEPRQKHRWTPIMVVTGGALLAIFVPLALLPVLPIDHLSEYGTVGDAIAGVSTPVTGLAGVILLFLALTAQLRANALTLQQVDAEAHKEAQQRDAAHLHQLYAFMDENIRQFDYERPGAERSASEHLHGRKAIRQFIDDIESSGVDIHDTNELLKKDGIREVLGVLEIAKQAFVKIESTDLDETSREFYAALVKHVLLYSIFPHTDLDSSNLLTLSVCSQCGEPHGNYPPAIFDRLQELKHFF